MNFNSGNFCRDKKGENIYQKLLGKIGAHCAHELFFTSVIITKKNVKAQQSVIAELQSRKETYNSKREKTREDKVMTMKGRIKKN